MELPLALDVPAPQKKANRPALAGGTCSAQLMPRIGMEVMVAFIGGNPDYPLAIGVMACKF
jgi:hypothetical protein